MFSPKSYFNRKNTLYSAQKDNNGENEWKIKK